MIHKDFKQYIKLSIEQWILLWGFKWKQSDIIDFAEFLINDTESRLEELEEKKKALFNNL